jgi:hypothetical protein
MPKTQVASVATYEFGAPAVAAEVLRFRALRGGKLALRFENPEGDADVTVSLKVSPDGVTTAALTANDNLVVVTDESIPQKQSRDYTILLREGVDTHLHVEAVGGARCTMQVRSDGAKLEDDLI